MSIQFQEDNFDDQAISCTKCDWQGKGAETIVIDFYGVVSDKEIHCPNCDKKLGILKKGNRPPGESATDLSFQIG